MEEFVYFWMFVCIDDVGEVLGEGAGVHHADSEEKWLGDVCDGVKEVCKIGVDIVSV